MRNVFRLSPTPDEASFTYQPDLHARLLLLSYLFVDSKLFSFSHQPPVLVQMDKEKDQGKGKDQDEDINKDQDKGTNKVQDKDNAEKEEQGSGQQPFSPIGSQHARWLLLFFLMSTYICFVDLTVDNIFSAILWQSLQLQLTRASVSLAQCNFVEKMAHRPIFHQ